MAQASASADQPANAYQVSNLRAILEAVVITAICLAFSFAIAGIVELFWD